MKLIDIPKSGEFTNEIILDDFLRKVVEATVSHYERIGFAQPWIGYVGLEGTIPVGVCGFKSQPVSGRVEISYATLPAHMGKGIATALARELVRIAREEDERLTVFAQTLPEENASTSILKTLGFTFIRLVEHPEDGTVWEWELLSNSAPTDSSR